MRARGKPRMRGAAVCLALVLFAVMLGVSESADCPDSAELKARKASEVTGNFLSGTISWTHVRDNVVLFEVISTWRRKHFWPCNTETGFSGEDKWPGLGDVLTIVGLSSVSSKQARQETSGPVSTKLWTGDGAELELEVKVTSYSIEEDWVMGVSYIEHKYSAPYKDKAPLYAVDGKPLQYVATKQNREDTQPFMTVPWVVELKGCCRYWEGKTNDSPKPDDMLNFNIRTTVDLSNHVASPRLVAMPILYARAGAGVTIPVCALSAGGPKAMVSKNGGTINYPDDDNRPAKFSWAVKCQSQAQNDGCYAASIDSVISDSKNGRCSLLKLGQDPKYEADDTDFVTIEVKMGGVMVSGDYAIFAKGPALVVNQVPSRAPFGCERNNICEGELSLGKKMPLWDHAATIDFQSTSGTPMEIRYVIATSSYQSTLLSTSQGTVRYSLTKISEDHAELPQGASLSPVSVDGHYVTDIDVTFSADQFNTRPKVDQFISNQQRDYTQKGGKGSAWTQVTGTNFNQGKGGAHVAVNIEKAVLIRGDVTNHDHLAAITGFQLANSSQVTQFEDLGYKKLNKNLLEQSDRGEVFIMYKRGSGPPVMDVISTPRKGYKNITAVTTNTQGIVARVALYVKYSEESRVTRTFMWNPCTGQDEEVIICAAANAWNASFFQPESWGSTMQCMLMDVVARKPPQFQLEKQNLYFAHMGKRLEIELQFKRSDLPLTDQETIPTVSFTEHKIECDTKACSNPVGENGFHCWSHEDEEVSDMKCNSNLTAKVTGNYVEKQDGTWKEYTCCKFSSTQPNDRDQVKSLLTGRTTTGSRITGSDKQSSGLSKLSTSSDSPAPGESQGWLLWTPSPYQGGWRGQVCVDACIQTQCPKFSGGEAAVCDTTCFDVAVHRCKWSLQGEDSFIEIAPRFQTNWLQLWFLNPEIGHPDHTSSKTYEQQATGLVEVNIGRLYKPRWDDTMASVSHRFGMSVQRLIDLNADLANVEEDNIIDPEREVCIIPDSCSLDPPSNTGKNM